MSLRQRLDDLESAAMRFAGPTTNYDLSRLTVPELTDLRNLIANSRDRSLDAPEQDRLNGMCRKAALPLPEDAPVAD